MSVKNESMYQTAMAEILSAINELENLIEYESLNKIWQKTDDIHLLFTALQYRDEDTDVLQQRFEEIIRDTQEVKRQMEKMEQEINAAARKIREECDQEFKTQLEAFEKAQHDKKQAELVEKILYEAEDICILAEMDHTMHLLNNHKDEE